LSRASGDTVANAGSADTPLTMSMMQCVPECGCAETGQCSSRRRAA
jgi:hypothetical protein